MVGVVPYFGAITPPTFRKNNKNNIASSVCQGAKRHLPRYIDFLSLTDVIRNGVNQSCQT